MEQHKISYTEKIYNNSCANRNNVSKWKVIVTHLTFTSTVKLNSLSGDPATFDLVLPSFLPTMDSTQQLIQENRDDISALRKIMAPSWVSSPSTRGTWDIFLSCFITLFACAYSVLHLNIPMNSNTWAVFRSKVKWVVFATLFPDVIVVMAFYQFTRARVLKKRLDELRVDNPNLVRGISLE